MSTSRALLYGTLAVGILDLLDAVVFSDCAACTDPHLSVDRLGLLGRAASSGGIASAAFGVALDFFIAFLIVAVFFLASRW